MYSGKNVVEFEVYVNLCHDHVPLRPDKMTFLLEQEQRSHKLKV